jgi:hypothetical protein
MISISILCALIIYLFGGYLDSANALVRFRKTIGSM